MEPLDNYPVMKLNTYSYPNSFIKVLNKNNYTTYAFHNNYGTFFNRTEGLKLKD